MTSRFVAKSGSVVHVEESGAGPPLLMVHGLGGGAYFFRGFAQQLSAHARTVAVDLPGTGRSTAVPASFSMAGWVADLGDLVSTHIGEPVVIVGHSLGTIIALEAWHAWPEWIRGLVLVGGLPEVRPMIRERLSRRIEVVTREGLLGLGEQVSAGIFSARTRATRGEMVGVFEQAFELQDPAAYMRTVEILLGASAARVVPTVRVPCLAVAGAEDQYAPPESVAEFTCDIPGPTETVVLAECGHMPFLEVPDEFARTVLAWFTMKS